MDKCNKLFQGTRRKAPYWALSSSSLSPERKIVSEGAPMKPSLLRNKIVADGVPTKL